MRQVQVYIEGNRIELFNDEQIQITSSVQNISDISKVFTDFSQSFTVPASTVNNAIFQHFYQSDVDSTIDHNIRRSAIIEIDLTTFRRGKIQIEKANIKDGLPENYQLTFYGEIRTLKDAFGEDKLNLLNLTSLEFQFTAANIYNRITDLATDYDVRYPLIASNRLWTYQHAGEDVTNTSHAISFEELFPAVKVSKLFEAIEAQYGITFTGTFLTDPRFTNVFLYGKNAIEYQYFTEISDILLDQVTTTVIEDPNIPNPGDLAYIDIYEDKINIIEAVTSARTEYNQCVTRQQKLLNDLKIKRSERLSNQVKENASILNLVQMWKDEDTRKEMIKMADMRREILKAEVGRLSSMDDVKARIFGLTEEEVLDG